ncbi:hypothetical protein [Streptomyces malaysiensis]|uniref:Uncharacterized protein n=1 Tax=Streptomyces malaysiensis TaxID=92644 RepID=A0A2J7Z9T9_STRMQ|nr:hypothetical protein [Streptomyces malaysiensis]PNG97025.1 hypothetical protein SMF913_13050 [Streptomyces malaysiensis]
MSNNPLHHLIGRDRAQEWTRARVDDLMTQDRLDQRTANAVVEKAIAADDPMILATPGQVWTLRPQHGGNGLPECLFVTERRTGKGGPRVVVEDGATGSQEVPLQDLTLYRLDTWFWSGPATTAKRR